MSHFYYLEDHAQKAHKDHLLWEGIRSLSLGFGERDVLGEVLDSPHLESLEELELNGRAITPALDHLALSGLPPKLANLSLYAKGEIDLRGLGGVFSCHQLEVLHLSGYVDESLGPMLDSTDSLRSVRLSRCLNPAQCEALAPHLAAILELHVSYNPAMGNEGLAALLEGLSSDVRSLSLDGAQLGADSGKLLARADLGGLTHLSLCQNPRFGDRGIEALLQAPWLASLRSLSLSGTGFRDKGALLLSETPALGDLKELRAMGLMDQVTDKGALALARSPHLEKLSYFWVHPWNLSPETCAELILARPHADGILELIRASSLSVLSAKAESLDIQRYRNFTMLEREELFERIRQKLPTNA